MSNPSPLQDALDHPQDAPQLAQPGDPGPELAQYERPPFPGGSPVRPLGISSSLQGSQMCFYLDVNKQLVGLEAGNRHGKNSMIALFGDKSDWLEAQWPQWSKPVREYDKAEKRWITVKEPEIVGFDQAEASRALIEECARRGIFTAAGKMRGTGAHRQRGTGLVLHCGDKLLASEHRMDGSIKGWHWTDPGLHEGYVYRGDTVIGRPAHEPASEMPAQKLVKLLMTWNWRRPQIDVRLLVGAIAASMVGGALAWRPNIWITGGAGTGKSTLNGQNGVLHQIFGDGLFRTGNASAAAIRQTLRNSTIPVMIDELEAGADNRKVTEVIELARVASSGDTMHRGGQDHQAHEFTLRSCFWFSSINIPPLQTQDRSRLGILELMPFAEGSVPPVLSDYHLGELGRQLQRRMVDGWYRLEATKAKYHAALSAVGHNARACDQFGTLLACADLLLFDWDASSDFLPDDIEVGEWATQCAPHLLTEVSENTPDHTACLIHLITSQVQARGGDERVQLSSWIGNAVAAAIDPLFDEHGVPDNDRSASRLQQLGLKLVNPRWYPPECDFGGEVVKPGRWGAMEYQSTEPGFLAVAGSHQGLAKIFEGKIWQNGVWRQSLGRTPGAIDGVKIKFGRSGLTAVLVPLDAVLVDDDELPAASKRAAREAWIAAQLAGAGK